MGRPPRGDVAANRFDNMNEDDLLVNLSSTLSYEARSDYEEAAVAATRYDHVNEDELLANL